MSQEKNSEKKSLSKKDTTQPSRTNATRREHLEKRENSAETKEAINKASNKIEKIINPLCLKLFKKFKCHQTNKYLVYRGPEIQLLYLCSNPHIGKVPLPEVVESFKDLLLKSDELKKWYSKLDIQSVALRGYVQIFVTIINEDLYPQNH